MQTDAEGNGDSISQAVQAERIALLTNVLNQVDASIPLPLNLQRRPSVPVNAAPDPAAYAGAQGLVQPLHSAPGPCAQMDLRTQHHPGSPVPGPRASGFYPLQHPQHSAIYQTASHPSSPHTRSSSARSRVPSPPAAALASPPLLPAFLQDIIQSDSAQSSPATSTSSWSFEELEQGDAALAYRYDAHFYPLREETQAREVGVIGRPRGPDTERQAKASAMYQSPAASTSSDIGLSIWRMDDAESRTFRFAGGGRGVPVFARSERSTEPGVDLAARFENKLSLVAA